MSEATKREMTILESKIREEAREKIRIAMSDILLYTNKRLGELPGFSNFNRPENFFGIYLHDLVGKAVRGSDDRFEAASMTLKDLFAKIYASLLESKLDDAVDVMVTDLFEKIYRFEAANKDKS